MAFELGDVQQKMLSSLAGPSLADTDNIFTQALLFFMMFEN
jgi:hypothetical protein